MEIKPLKLKSHAVLKPWGLVHGSLKDITGISVGVGELWLASAQTGEGNSASELIGDFAGTGDLAGLLREADRGSELERWLGSAAYSMLKGAPYRGKTEAWVVRESRGFAGFIAGPSTEAEKKELKSLIKGPGIKPDIRQWPEAAKRLFGLTAAEAGESFLVPAGTLHTMFASGEESLLVVDEIQQGYGKCLLPTLSKTLLVQDSILSVQVHPDDDTVSKAAAGEMDAGQDLQANPTVRVYDFGRRPGEDIDLGFRLVDAACGLRRIAPLKVDIGGVEISFLVACPNFFMAALKLEAGAEFSSVPVLSSYRVLHCTRGRVDVMIDKSEIALESGETLFIPGDIEGRFRLQSVSGGAVTDQAVPDIPALKKWLSFHGTGGKEVRKFLNPGRV